MAKTGKFRGLSLLRTWHPYAILFLRGVSDCGVGGSSGKGRTCRARRTGGWLASSVAKPSNRARAGDGARMEGRSRANGLE